MAAGLGFKTFTTGEVLTAGDVNGYLMQGINVFANATARDAAITSPQEGQFAYTKDNNSLWYYTGSAWAASGATGDIEGVTVTSPLTGGGTSGTVTVGILSGTTSNLGAVQLSDSTSSTSTTLAATANAVKSSYDLANAAVPKSTVTTNGDLIYGTGSSTVSRLGIGSSGQVLTVSSGVPAWATPAAGGGETLLSTTTLSGSSTTVSSISGSYKHLKIIVKDVGSSGSSALSFRINGGTSNYNYGYMRVYASAFGGSQTTNGAEFQFVGANGGGGSSNANTRTVSVIDLPRYTDTTQVCTWQSYGAETGGSPGQMYSNGAGYYNGGSALTSVTLICQSSTFTQGTMYIYGVN